MRKVCKFITDKVDFGIVLYALDVQKDKPTKQWSYRNLSTSPSSLYNPFQLFLELELSKWVLPLQRT